MTPHISTDQRRARLAWRHALAGPVPPDRGPQDVTADLVALHATDAATVHLAVAARLHAPLVETVEEALYERRTLLRMLGMRRTMFVVPTGFAPVVQAAATRAVAADQRKLLVRHLTESGVGDADWLADVEEATYRALAARGSATAAQLAVDEPRLRSQMVFPQGSQYVTSRVLFLLAADGRIVRGRPVGSWLSSQYLWSTADGWLPDGGLPALDPAAARTELVRAWLARNGPGTAADLKWWTGWTLTQVKAALAALAAVPVTLDGGDTGYVLADDVDPVAEPEPWVALLPALDPTVMGWTSREWYLGPHAPALFDRSGNPGPTVWAGGRVVGGWAQRPSGEVAVELLEDVPAAVRRAVGGAAADLEGWLDGVRVTPRFRTPLERRLSA
ncbi:winged helix DNA-binding domain-containing protein [Dactylosporangium fulvum]|uniref:Winged helix DNA-binding domain-containing protein n=1 Tax=Dactylosporangium fulvum TaxID=53359 RepID=A0ABY5VN36_9ACTN|nr:winged helix DNA-binding domain-containing protein [Dactylosporangium fulvum]UWP78474.1 winged helix DNA-binding domain-containing protein [Dactylosporangium fulvum]